MECILVKIVILWYFRISLGFYLIHRFWSYRITTFLISTAISMENDGYLSLLGSFYDITPPHSYIYRSWRLVHIITSANFCKPNNNNSGKSLLKAMTMTLYYGKMIKNVLQNTEIASLSGLDLHEIIVYFHCFWYSEAFFFWPIY